MPGYAPFRARVNPDPSALRRAAHNLALASQVIKPAT
jgi:hypothetical protein